MIAASLAAAAMAPIAGSSAIATTGGRIWERCAEAIGAPNLPKRPEYATAPARSKNRDALNAEINALTEKKSTDA
jgi:formyl-CoA transferase